MLVTVKHMQIMKTVYRRNTNRKEKEVASSIFYTHVV